MASKNSTKDITKKSAKKSAKKSTKKNKKTVVERRLIRDIRSKTISTAFNNLSKKKQNALKIIVDTLDENIKNIDEAQMETLLEHIQDVNFVPDDLEEATAFKSKFAELWEVREFHGAVSKVRDCVKIDNKVKTTLLNKLENKTECTASPGKTKKATTKKWAKPSSAKDIVKDSIEDLIDIPYLGEIALRALVEHGIETVDELIEKFSSFDKSKNTMYHFLLRTCKIRSAGHIVWALVCLTS